MAFEEIREYFSRHVLGRIRVRSGAISLRKPRVLAPRRSVETYPLRARMEVRSPAILAFQGSLSCSSEGFRFSGNRVEVKGERVRAPGEITVSRVPIRLRLQAREGLKRAFSLPQERVNRLKWRRLGDARPGEMILAWYGPIIQDAVIKLSLNKRRGTLLVWYNPNSRQFKAGEVCLCRRLGPGEKPEWRWA